MDAEDRFNDTGRVRQVALPPDARALSTLSRIDYADAFVLETGPADYRTAEAWSRVILEAASDDIRHKLRSGWSRLGLRLGQSDECVLGWPIRRSTPEFVLLSADSRIGMRGELLFERRRDSLLFATLLEHDNVIARAIWAAVVPTHIKLVRQLLEQACRRAQPMG
jgi:hypothetical protein